MSWFLNLQEALVYVLTPIVYGMVGIILIGSFLASLINVFMDVAANTFKD